MPLKCSEMRFPVIAAGTRISLRYHHGTANGLVESIGRWTKFFPMPYVIPGIERRFIPTKGSLKTLSSTSVPTTVDGTVALYHPLALYAAEEIAAPSVPAFAED